MSGDETNPEAEYFAHLFSGEAPGASPKAERELLESLGGAFALAVAVEVFRDRHPDPADRRKVADTLLAMFQSQWDQMLARHREMMESVLGKAFGSAVIGADDAAEKIERMAEKGRAYLYHLAGVEP